MDEIETRPRRFRIRSRFDPKWIVMFAIGMLISVAYYGAVLWAAVWLFRKLMAWLFAS